MRDAGFLARSGLVAYGAWNAHRCCQSGPSFVGQSQQFNSLPCLALRHRACYLQDRGRKLAFAWGRGRLRGLLLHHAMSLHGASQVLDGVAEASVAVSTKFEQCARMPFIAAQTPWVSAACLLALCFCAQRATSRAAASGLGVAGCLTWSTSPCQPCTGAKFSFKECPSHLQLVTLMTLLYEDVPWGLRKFGASGLRVPGRAGTGIRRRCCRPQWPPQVSVEPLLSAPGSSKASASVLLPFPAASSLNKPVRLVAALHCLECAKVLSGWSSLLGSSVQLVSLRGVWVQSRLLAGQSQRPQVRFCLGPRPALWLEEASRLA